MSSPTPGTSTQAPPNADDVEVITISDDEAETPPVQLHRLSCSIKATFNECKQLFGATCEVKLTRCQTPVTFASSNPVVKDEDSSSSSEEDEPPPTPTVPAQSAAVTASKIVPKAEDESLTGSSSDEGEILPIRRPSKKPVTVAAAKITVKEEDSSSASEEEDEPAQTGSAAVPFSYIVPKAEDESSTGSGSSSEEDESLAVTPPSTKPDKKKKRGRKPVDCPTCGKTLAQKQYLKLHMKIHTRTEEDRKKCEHCGHTFCSQESLGCHKTLNPNGSCKVKNRMKDLRQKKNQQMARELLKQKWRPTGRWNCKICEKSIKYPGYYIRHMTSHAGERRFKCAQCGKGFNRRSTLSDHRRIHSKVKEFTCVFCEKGFHHERNLFRHLRWHTEEKPHFCVVTRCGASFRNQTSLKRHQRLIHLKRC